MDEDRQRSLVPQDEASPERWRDLVERTLGDRAALAERMTSWGRDHPCPRCGSRNVAMLTFGLLVYVSDELARNLEAGEWFHAGCVMGAARSRCNECEHAFPEDDRRRLTESRQAGWATHTTRRSERYGHT